VLFDREDRKKLIRADALADEIKEQFGTEALWQSAVWAAMGRREPWTGNRRARWKVASHFAIMWRLLFLGAFPSGVLAADFR